MSDRETPQNWRRHPDCWKMEALHWHRLCFLKDQAMESHQLVNKSDLDDAERKLAEVREVMHATTVLIAAKGRHNTMLAYDGLRKALSRIDGNDNNPATGSTLKNHD